METLARKLEAPLICSNCGAEYQTTRKRKAAKYCSQSCCAEAKSLPLKTPIAVVREMYLVQNPTNNQIENLAVVSRQRHGELHKQLEAISAQLYKEGKITYCPQNGYQITKESQ